MKEHKLKTWVEYFQLCKTGQKSFEVRKNDRDYKVGDTIILEEWDNEKQTYTGEKLTMAVGYILHGGQFGIEKGYCVMQIF